MTALTSTKPYLFRAILQWIEDNSMTPHIIVNALANGVLVPQEYVQDGQITLNIASSSIQLHQMDNLVLQFSARFNGVSQDITVPMDSVLGIYSRENGQGMFFDPEEFEQEAELNEISEEISEHSGLKEEITQSTDDSKENQKTLSKKKKSKRSTSHLKVIK